MHEIKIKSLNKLNSIKMRDIKIKILTKLKNIWKQK